MRYLTAQDAQKLVDTYFEYCAEMRKEGNTLDSFDYQVAHILGDVFSDAARGFTKREIQMFDWKNNREMWSQVKDFLLQLGFNAYSYCDWYREDILVIEWKKED